MTKRDEEIDELRREFHASQLREARRDGFFAGARSVVKHMAIACGVIWTGATFFVNVFGELAYHKIPVVKQIVDIFNGAPK